MTVSYEAAAAFNGDCDFSQVILDHLAHKFNMTISQYSINDSPISACYTVTAVGYANPPSTPSPVLSDSDLSLPLTTFPWYT